MAMALSSALTRLGVSSIRNSLANFQQVRTELTTSTSTNIVKRRWEARLRKPHKNPSLRQRHYIYDTIQNNQPIPQALIPILLKKFVEDIGQPGEIVHVKEQQARLLIMTQKAAYPSKTNLERFGHDATRQKSYSSKYVATTMNELSKFVLNISMNKENAWTIEPWHVRSAFRKAGVQVPETAIEMPENVISGPDMNLEGKEFYVTVTINGQEKQKVRCRIHHWATNIRDRMPIVRDHWRFPVETVFVEDKEITKTLPEMIPPVFDENDDWKPPPRRR